MAASVPTTDAPLLFQGGRMTEELWSLGLDSLYRWLEAAVENLQSLGVGQAQIRESREILEQTRLISLANGSCFNQQPALAPNQHIHRSRNKDWKSKFATQSKLNMDISWRHPGRQHEKAPKLSWWSSSDLLGLLMAGLGPAPDGANEKNFYLPLLALYARWCHTISGRRGANGKPQNGTGDPAFVFQCTWNQTTREFFLGATLSGYSWSQQVVGQWESVVRGTRFQLLSPFHGLKTEGFWANGQHYPWQIGNSVNVVLDKDTGNQFGNCAETYPFLVMMSQRDWNKEERGQCHGLALTRDFIPMPTYSQQQILQPPAPVAGAGRQIADSGYRYLMKPCRNCAYLIGIAGGNELNFWPSIAF